jgi:hypothetical protein
MLLRRTTPFALAILALACEPSVPYHPETAPASVDYAGFDPTGSPPLLPLPNQLALTEQAIAAQNPSQAAVLRAFNAAGGFPNDQEVPITIPFVRVNVDAVTGAQTRSVPAIDATSINGTNLLILSISTQGGFTPFAQCATPGPNCYDAPTYDSTTGILTVRKSPNPAKSGTRRWDPATYVVAVRGGPNGVKVTGGTSAGVQPQAAMYLLERCTPTCPNGKGFTDPQNQGLFPGTREEKAVAAAQLETVRKGYLVPFLAVDGSGKFTHNEVATMGVFKIADVQTHVETDPSSGQMPLPSDFLMDSTGHLSPEGQVAFNAFAPGLGTGLASLDGFSTTAMILSQTSGPILADTVKNNVFLYELNLAVSPPTATRLLHVEEALLGGRPDKAAYAPEPDDITQTLAGNKLSTVIGLQPAVPAPISATALVPLPPLKENTTYVVVVTDGVKDINNTGLTRSTLGKLLLLDPALPLSTNGKSLVAGPTDAQAVGLDQMRGAINLAAGTLAAEKPAMTRDHVVMAYTFHTQSFKTTGLKLAALPYTTPASTGLPLPAAAGGGANVLSPSAAFDKYGIDRSVVPSGNVDSFIETAIVTFNNLGTNGAFNDPAVIPPTAEAVSVLISVPKVGNFAAASCVGPGGSPPCLAPLAIFRHGLNKSRAGMLLLADRFAAQGIVVASIDAAKHGDRSYCSALAPLRTDPAASADPSPNAECVSGAFCVPDPALEGKQGDPVANGGFPSGAPGKCRVANSATAALAAFKRKPGLCLTQNCRDNAASANAGTSVASGNYLVSSNFFRTRDTWRQDIIDVAQLIRVLGTNPLQPPAAGTNPVFDTMAAKGVLINGGSIYLTGNSFGSFQGTMEAAVISRVKKAVFSAGGATIVDVFTRAPDFAASVGGLLASLKITPGTAAYLQFLIVAKWIIDGADPINYAVNVKTSPLPDLLANSNGSVLQGPKKYLGFVAQCDTTVPNPFNLLLYGAHNPAIVGSNNVAADGVTIFVDPSKSPAACPTGPVAHSFYLEHGITGVPGSTTGAVYYDANYDSLCLKAENAAATFLNTDALPPPIVTP